MNEFLANIFFFFRRFTVNDHLNDAREIATKRFFSHNFKCNIIPRSILVLFVALKLNFPFFFFNSVRESLRKNQDQLLENSSSYE